MELQILITIIAFLLGSSIGSFLSVFINRHYNQEPGTINGRSHCPNCQKQLQVRDLIPFFSYILSRGKCRFCKKPIGRHYFYLELFTGFLYALLVNLIPFYTNFETTLIIQFVFTLIISTQLIAIFFYDLLYREIPDILSMPAIALAIIFAIVSGTPDWDSIGIATAIITIFFGGQILVSRGQWLGIGDLILGILMAILLGWQNLLLALGLSYVIGATYGVTLLLVKKANSKAQIAFGPFLVTGTIVALLFGDKIIHWYLSSIIY